MLSLLLVPGCVERPSSPPTASRASVTLRVLVVNEPALAEAINRLRGEWAERSGGELIAQATTWKERAKKKQIDADLIVFPSRYLGELCVCDQLRPVRSGVLEDDDFNSADLFPLVRNELMKWGGQTMALPLGIDPTAIDPPASPPQATSLLTAAAPRAISNERLGVLFDTETMKPRITEPPFVDALTRGLVPLSAVIPVLGNNDRLIAVTASSHNAASAFKLLQWLAQADTSSQLARVGRGLLPPRRSLISSADWYDVSLSANDRSARGTALDAALSGQQCLLIPRIPGIDDYLAALEDAVKAAVVDKTSPATTLQTAADRWEKITDSHGRDAQRRAYLKHLGISDK